MGAGLSARGGSAFGGKLGASASFFLLFFVTSCASAPFPPGRAVDLTHPFNRETIYWPTESGFELTTRAEGLTPQGYFYYANAFSAAEHGGTHLDAPRHFSQAGRTLDEIPVEQLMGRAVRIDVTEKCRNDRDYQITENDFLDWERKRGPIPERSMVLLETGFGKFWPDRLRYLGTLERGPGAVKKLHFPGLLPEAARWLVRERNIRAVGIDTASIDYGQSEGFETHVVLATGNIPILENIASLEKLPSQGFQIIALPMKIEKGSGGPARVIAFIEK